MRLINDGIRPGIPQQNYGRIAAAIRYGGNFRYRITISKKKYTFDDKPILTFKDNTLKIEYEGSAIPPPPAEVLESPTLISAVNSHQELK